MPYTHFRYIAYEVPTTAPDPSQGLQRGQLCDLVARLPVPDDDPLSRKSPDAFYRLRRMAAVIDRAEKQVQRIKQREHQRNQPVSEQHILTVFTAPEFYFRPSRAESGSAQCSAYSSKHASAFKNAFQNMFGAQQARDDFKNWLFVTGTVVWCYKEQAGLKYANAALLYLPGGSGPYYIKKRNPSEGDGLPLEATVQLDPKDDANILSKNVFNIEEHRFGLEVCKDHNTGVLQRALSRRGSGLNQRLALHFLIAAGMGHQRGFNVAMKNGFFLRNDGAGSDEYQYGSEFLKVLAVKKPRRMNGKDLGIGTIDESKEPAPIPSSARFSFQQNEKEFVPDTRNFAQSIVLYPQQPIPKAVGS